MHSACTKCPSTRCTSFFHTSTCSIHKYPFVGRTPRFPLHTVPILFTISTKKNSSETVRDPYHPAYSPLLRCLQPAQSVACTLRARERPLQSHLKENKSKLPQSYFIPGTVHYKHFCSLRPRWARGQERAARIIVRNITPPHTRFVFVSLALILFFLLLSAYG